MARLLYFICTTNRTGSSWLCAMLRSTGVAGHVGEIVRKRRPEDEWKANLQTDPYGAKLNPPMMRRLWPLVDPIERRLAKFIWLVRRDTWRQAISQYRAMQSRVWHVSDGEPIPGKHFDVPFDRKAIQETREEFMRQDRLWRRWFADNDIRPLKIEYEGLCAEPRLTVRRVLTHLGLAYKGQIQIETHRVLRDELTEEWVRKLAEDVGGVGESEV